MASPVARKNDFCIGRLDKDGKMFRIEANAGTVLEPGDTLEVREAAVLMAYASIAIGWRPPFHTLQAESTPERFSGPYSI